MTTVSEFPIKNDSFDTGVSGIREVFNYIKRYKQKTFVLKIEDSLILNPLFPLLMKDIIQLHDIGINIVIIPGIRTTIEEKLSKANISTRFVNGVRITPAEALPLVKLAAMEVTETIISHLAVGGANGIMGNWITARAIGVDQGVDYECTGCIEKVRSDIVIQLLEQNFIPVIYNIGFNSTGKSYNVNSSHITSQLCRDLDVIKLFFIGNDEGIPVANLELPKGIETHPTGIFSSLDLSQVDYLLEHNMEVLNLNYREYLENAREATRIQNGVNRVHIICGTREGSLLQEVFSSMGQGTMIYRNKYAHIRVATCEDVPEILHLMDGYVKKGNLVLRSEAELNEQISDYYIYEVDRAVYGCGALYRQDDDAGEIGAIAVNSSYKSKGVGQGIMEFLIDLGRKRELKRLFLLTTQTSDWFYKFGFILGTPADLPPGRKARYNNERNSRVLLLDL
jgi:amino-acid N-acetyltransferase